MHQSPLPPGLSWYSFLEAELTPGHMELLDATEITPATPGIDPGTFRLNHYFTPDPILQQSECLFLRGMQNGRMETIT